MNGSTVRIINALSPVAIAAAGSSNAVNLAGYEQAMLILSVGSAPTGAGFLVSVQRSATSNGTFSPFGASLPGQNTNNKVVTRSFAVNSSATWHKVFYDNSNLGSAIVNVEILAHVARTEPVVSQESNVSVYSDITSG
jgi:hypothetical protein